MDLKQIREAFKDDASQKPYFFRGEGINAAEDFIIKLGREMLLSMTPIFSSVVRPNIDDIYNFIWDRFDLILEADGKYFTLYYDYTIEMLEFYLDLSEKSEMYEVCQLIKNLLIKFEDRTQ